MGLVSLVRLALAVVAVVACSQPALASDEAWQSHKDYLEARAKINGILLRQDIERATKGGGASTRGPSSLPTSTYPAAPQSPGSGVIVPRPNGDVEVVRGQRGTGPGSEVIDIQVREVFPKRKIVQRIVESLPIVGSAVSGALLIKELLEEARVMEGPGDTILMDPGQPEVAGYVWQQNDFGTPAVCQTSTPGATLQCGVDKVLLTWPDALGTCQDSGPVKLYDTQYRRSFYPLRQGFQGGQYCDTANGRTVMAFRKTGMLCPEGQSVSFWQDDWCTTDVDDWQPVTVEEATDRVEQKVAPGAAPEILRELDEKGIGVDGDLPSIQGPSSIHRGRETTTNPDGSTTVRDTSSDIRYGPQQAPDGTVWPGWEWSDRETVRTYPPEATIPPPNDPTAPPPDQETIVDGNPSGGLEDLITCGLPWTPPCKIDETGTPTAPIDQSGADVDGIMSDLSACLASPAACLPELPDLSWSFSLPEGCAPLDLPGYSDHFGPLDVCQFQPVLHDILSMLWVAAGLFGAIALVSREMMGSPS